MAKIGIIIPIMGNKRYVMAALDSANNQAGKHEISVFAIDNGSKDGTTDELYRSENAEKMLWLESHPEPLGVAKAWNIGIRKAIELGMDYIVVMNSDLLLHKDCINEMVDLYETHNTLILVTANPVNHLLGLDTHPRAVKPFEEYQQELDALPATDNNLYILDFSCFLIEPKYMDLVGEFDEKFVGAYFEDNDAHWRIVKAGFGALSIKSAMTLHFSSRSIREGGYHNSGFIANENYFHLKHNTNSKDANLCPGWIGPLGNRSRLG